MIFNFFILTIYNINYNISNGNAAIFNFYFYFTVFIPSYLGLYLYVYSN